MGLLSFSSTCMSGQWVCTQFDCSRTCGIIRNVHYTTFGGQYLKVNSGTCAYTAATLKDNPKKFHLVLKNAAAGKEPSDYGSLEIDGEQQLQQIHEISFVNLF